MRLLTETLRKFCPSCSSHRVPFDLVKALGSPTSSGKLCIQFHSPQASSKGGGQGEGGKADSTVYGVTYRHLPPCAQPVILLSANFPTGPSTFCPKRENPLQNTLGCKVDFTEDSWGNRKRGFMPHTRKQTT